MEARGKCMQNAVSSVYNPTYESEPFVDFETIGPSTEIEELNLNWQEKDLPERIRTKHVHRLHPYLGKFIPQLVEIFLRKYEPKTVYDPFSGSGTTLVEAKSLGINSVGCDISEFNVLLSKVKTDDYDILLLEKEVKDIVKQFRIKNENTLDRSPILTTNNKYLNTWFAPKALHELLLFQSLIEDYEYQDVLKLFLSRSARSARLTKHFDLDFPKKPQTEPYDCFKHSRVCKPVEIASKFLTRYSYDGLKRIKEFSEVKNDASVELFCHDSRTVKIPNFDVLFTSPPYLGLIDYHEQHRYAYELLGLTSRDDEEIGPAFKGRSNGAKDDYVTKIYEVFKNAVKYMNEDGRIIIVVADKKDFYSSIRDDLGAIEEHKISRHVNRRTGRRNSAFYEDVLIWKV